MTPFALIVKHRGVSANQRLRGVSEGSGAFACQTSAGHSAHAYLG